MNPKPGQVWEDGISRDIAWRVESIDTDGAMLQQLRDGEPTSTRLLWADGRPWQLFVDRQQLTLRRARKAAAT